MLDPGALDALKNGQRQLDADGCEVGVSRQALDELIAAYESLSTITPAEAGGLVTELRNPDFRGSMQHLRSAGEIDRLFQQSATALEAQAAELEGLRQSEKSYDAAYSAGVEWKARSEAAEAQRDEAREALKQIVSIDEASGYGLTIGDAIEAVAIARRALAGGKADG